MRLRVTLALLLLLLQLTGIYRLPTGLFFSLIIVGLLLTLFNLWASRQHWSVLPTFNLIFDQLITLLIIAGTGGAASPYVFICYIHVSGAIVFNGSARLVTLIAFLQLVNLGLGTLLAPMFGLGSSFAYAAVHSMALLIIAYFLMEPARILHQEAQTDPLTGALNRRSGLRELEGWIATGQPFSVLFTDMKHFKQVNDNHGHAVGDEVLAEVARLLRRSVRAPDLVIRYGGDEFLTATRSEPEPVVGRLREALLEPLTTSIGEVSVKADLGVARYPQDATALDELIELADGEMFKVKRTEF